jgi:methionyl aminopeptidase
MKIILKTPSEVEIMRESCTLAAAVLDYIEPFVKPGISANELNDLCHNFIVEKGAYPSPLNYKGFPKSICTSINEVVCHGIPDNSVLMEGDIINLDITTLYKEFHGDTSKTFLVGKTSRAARDLVKVAEEALWIGIKAIRPGGRIGDIGAAIQEFVLPKGYSIVEEYGGHGIGRIFHEDPHVSHVGKKGTGPEIKPGMVFTVEPMINLGKRDIVQLDDGWTVETKDQKISAQFEHTVAIFSDRVEVLTLSPHQNLSPIVWKQE